MKLIKRFGLAIAISSVCSLVWKIMDYLLYWASWHTPVGSYFDVWFFGTLTAYIAISWAQELKLK